MNRDFRNHTNDNWTIIENALNTLEKLGKEDKEEVLARIDNLIINSGNSNAEVADARLDAEGNNHTVLKKRLDADQQKTAAQIESVTQDISGVKTSITNMSDPLSYLNSVSILSRIPTKKTISNKILWLQGFNINDEKMEIYANYQDETLMRIEILDFNGSVKENKSISITANSYTESLPYFYNGNNELNFIIRTKPDSTYNIYNFTKGTLSADYQLQGRRTIAVRDGDRLVTVDENSSTGAITGLNIYEWDSIKIGNPKLLGKKSLETTINTPEKTQGIVQNKAYTFLMQGAWQGQPYLTVLNNAGKIINVFRYSKRSLAEIINKHYPGAIKPSEINTWEYESEGGCIYKGKLVTTQVTPDWAYLFVHNMADGTPIEMEIDTTQAIISDGASVSVFFRRTLGAIVNTGPWVLDAGNTPKFQQGDNIVSFSGGFWTFQQDGMYDIDAFTSVKGKDQAAEHTLAVQLIERTTDNVADAIELDGKANGYSDKWTRISGSITWYFNKGDRIKIVYTNTDGGGVESYENRITFKKI